MQTPQFTVLKIFNENLLPRYKKEMLIEDSLTANFKREFRCLKKLANCFSVTHSVPYQIAKGFVIFSVQCYAAIKMYLPSILKSSFVAVT